MVLQYLLLGDLADRNSFSKVLGQLRQLLLYKFEHLDVLWDFKYVSSVLLLPFVFVLSQLAECSDLQITRIACL